MNNENLYLRHQFSRSIIYLYEEEIYFDFFFLQIHSVSDIFAATTVPYLFKILLLYTENIRSIFFCQKLYIKCLVLPNGLLHFKNYSIIKNESIHMRRENKWLLTFDPS